MKVFYGRPARYEELEEGGWFIHNGGLCRKKDESTVPNRHRYVNCETGVLSSMLGGTKVFKVVPLSRKTELVDIPDTKKG